MTKQTFTQKSTGDSLSASEWNDLTSYVNTAVDEINANAGGGSSAIDTAGVVTVNSKGNTTISAVKNINIEPTYDPTGSTSGTYGDVQIKPGDDITLESHHRSTDKRDEITIKTSNGQSGSSKATVKLQVIAADMTLSSKGKTEDSNVMNINVTDGTGKGYLKVRAQAIDLRCEEHGGIALQPKGTDGQGYMNKIKFEHGGGDGLEFGTFNSEKTSIFTDEYRFNKDGVWKMATRTKETSDKYDVSDSTTHYKYVKAADDFYDNIDVTDAQCTTKDIIKVADALSGHVGVHTKITNKGDLEIGTSKQFLVTSYSELPSGASVDCYGQYPTYISPIGEENQGTPAEIKLLEDGKYYSSSEILDILSLFSDGSWTTPYSVDLETITDPIYVESGIPTNSVQSEPGIIVGGLINEVYYKITPQPIPNIKIDSGAELKLGGILDFGSSFNFGETDNGIEVQYKLTKKNNTKDCGVLKVVGVNNHASNDLTVEGVTITPGQTGVIAQCSLLDIIKLVNYMKTNNEGPWAPQL